MAPDDADAARPTPTPLGVLDLIATADAFVRGRFDDEIGSWHGLNRMDLRFLLLLDEAPEQQLLRTRLAALVGVPPSVAAKRLGPMERMGLVERTSTEGGASQVELTLTDAGRTMTQDAGRTAREIAADLVESRYTLDELDTLTELLARLDPSLQI